MIMADMIIGKLMQRGAADLLHKVGPKMLQRGVASLMVIRPSPTRCILLVSIPATYLTIRFCRRISWRHWFFNTNFGNWFYTFVTDVLSSPIMPDLRQRVKDVDLSIQHTSPRNHSHPIAARERCIANTYMEHATIMLGLRAYHYQLSPTQQRLQLAGHRSIYCAKDLQMRKQSDTLKAGDMILLTDVDYYLDMREMLQGSPVLCYTFVPEEVAGTTEDGVYCIHEDDTVEVTTNGGSKYRHPLWDYDDDHLVIDTWTCSYVYLVEQIRITSSRRVIFFNPIRKVPAPFGWILPGRRLRRRAFNVNGVVYSKFTRTTDGTVGVWHSLAKAGQHIACNVKEDAFYSAYIRLTENKEPHLSDVERYFNTYKVDNSLYASSLFYHVFKTNPSVFNFKLGLVTPCITPVDRHTYQSVSGLVSEDGTPTMRAIWPGYCSTFSPAKSYNNDLACIKGRIDDVKNQRPKLPPIYYSFMNEYVQHIVPMDKRHTLSPLAYESIWEQFDRPNQRALLRQADYNMDSAVFVKSFQKREPYPKITAPRNISTLPTAHNALLAQFTLPLLNHVLKNCHWYAFGKHPKEMSHKLMVKATTTSSATLTDFNKLDGSIRGFFRDLLVSVLCAAFDFKYHDEIVRTEAKERHAKCTTSHGVKYKADSTILSGSSLTSILGTLTNSFIMYVSYRYRYGPDEAWEKLGMYGGDDGISFDLDPHIVVRTAGKFGLLCEAEAVQAGLPVKFLGRVYLDLWTSDQSMADVQRQFRKLHLTASPNIVPDWMVLYRKATGYRVTDPNTPLLTAWCDAVIRHTQQYSPSEHKFWKLTKTDANYWSKFDSPFNPPTDQQHAAGYVAQSLGLTVSEMYVYEMKFRNSKCLEDLYLVDIVNLPQPVTIDVVHRGELVKAKPSIKVVERVKANAAKKLGLCRYTRRSLPCPYADCKFSHTRPDQLLNNHKRK